MTGWFGRSRREEALERELAALREAFVVLEARIAGEAASTRMGERMEALAQQAAEATRRGESAETRAGDAAAMAEGACGTLATLTARLDLLEERPDRHDVVLTDVAMSLLRLERQLQVQAGETEKVGKALFERIEALRPTLSPDAA